MSIMRNFAICLLMLIGVSAYAEGVPDDCTQLILGIAPTWDSMRGEVRLFERSRGEDWVSVAGPFAVLFGKNGIAWGTGLAGQNEPGLRKKERDGRAPAGVFEIGQVFGYNPHLPAGGDYPYHQVTEADVWSDDPRSPNYNRHVVIDPKNPPDNYTHEKMRSGDFAYEWLIEIRHNSDPPVPGVRKRDFFSYSARRESANHRLHNDGEGKPGEAHHVAASEHDIHVTHYCQQPNTIRNGAPGTCLLRRRFTILFHPLIESWHCLVSFLLVTHAKTKTAQS